MSASPVSSPFGIFPWLASVWQQTINGADSLHHGLLLTGIDGIGKREFAISLSRRLLCADPAVEGACGRCQNCLLFDAGTHPDLHILATEAETASERNSSLAVYSDRYQDITARQKRANPARVIPVDQVRLLIERFYQSAHISSHKVAIIVPADRMNANAANALLKLLEEPPENSHFILVSTYPGLLPATIRSRCIAIALTAPDLNQGAIWLQSRGVESPSQLMQEHPGEGPVDLFIRWRCGDLELQRDHLKQLVGLLAGKVDPVALAANLCKSDVTMVLVLLQRFCVSLAKWQGANVAPPWISLTGLVKQHISAPALQALYERTGQYRRMARDQLNAQLALEELLLGLVALATSGHRDPAPPRSAAGKPLSGSARGRIVRATR